MSSIIKDLRLQRRLTLQDAAKQARVARSYLARVERGDANPSRRVLAALAGLYEVPVSTLIGDEPRKVSRVAREVARDKAFRGTLKDVARLAEEKRPGPTKNERRAEVREALIQLVRLVQRKAVRAGVRALHRQVRDALEAMPMAGRERKAILPRRVELEVRFKKVPGWIPTRRIRVQSMIAQRQKGPADDQQ